MAVSEIFSFGIIIAHLESDSIGFWAIFIRVVFVYAIAATSGSVYRWFGFNIDEYLLK